MASRPRLKPYFRPLRRSPDTVQLGLSAGSGGVVLSGLGAAEIVLLTRIDGTHTEPELLHDAAGLGIPPERAAVLVALLRRHHLLDGDLDGAGPDRVDLGRLPGASLALARLGVDDAPILALPPSGVVLAMVSGDPEETPGVHVVEGASEQDGFVEVAGRAGARAVRPAGPTGTRQLLHRTGWRVVVSGRGRLPWAIGSLLRTTGVGQVDLGTPAVHALDQALRADPGSTAPDLVVLVGSSVLDARSGDPWWRRGIPTLPVVTDGRRIVVGPVVDDPSGPCLHCLDLERADRDAAWPTLVRQVSGAGGAGVDDEISSETTLSAMASGVVAMIVTAHLAGAPTPTGVSVEMSLPWPRLDHRRWTRHPQCAAHRPRARSVAARETMKP